MIMVVSVIMIMIPLTCVGINRTSGTVALGSLTDFLKGVDALSGHILLLTEIMVGNHATEGRHTRRTRA